MSDPEQTSDRAVVFLLSSGWVSDDLTEHGVFSTIEKARAAAPSDVVWEAAPAGDRLHEGCNRSAFDEKHPWWIEEFEIDRNYLDEDSEPGAGGGRD